MNIVLTMAGAGSRFKDAGYTVDKYAIDFKGHSLFEWSLVSLLAFRDARLVVVTLRFAGIEAFVNEAASRLGFSSPVIVYVDAVTRGQAESACLAQSVIGRDEEVLIYNTDTHVHPDALGRHDATGDGWIPCFSAPGDKWSFVETDSEGLALRVTEKQRISDHCSVGLYYFRRFEDLVDATRRHAAQAKEWYIAPLYNDLIESGKQVRITQISTDAVLVLGTPDDLKHASERPNVSFPTVRGST